MTLSAEPSCQPPGIFFFIESRKIGMDEIARSEYESNVFQICSTVFLNNKGINDKVIQIVC